MMFQSLFYWKYHFNLLSPAENGGVEQVSILVLLEVPLQRRNGPWKSSYKIRFQSLFYWKYHFNADIMLKEELRELGFNPCFTGSTTSTTCHLYRLLIRGNVSILVLLEVPLQLVCSPTIKFEILTGFNPCFTGSTTSTLPSEWYRLDGLGFNPCFTGSTTSTRKSPSS